MLTTGEHCGIACSDEMEENPIMSQTQLLRLNASIWVRTGLYKVCIVFLLGLTITLQPANAEKLQFDREYSADLIR